MDATGHSPTHKGALSFRAVGLRPITVVRPLGELSSKPTTRTAVHIPRYQILTLLSLSEFITTEIDEALIAKAANIGLMRMPRKG